MQKLANGWTSPRRMSNASSLKRCETAFGIGSESNPSKNPVPQDERERTEIIVFTSTGVAGICKDGEYVEWGRSSSPSADGERWYMAVKDDDGTSFFDEDGDPMCEHFGCFKKAKWRNCDGRPTCGEFSPL